MKTLHGKVVSLKMNKTVVVEITVTKRHPIYGRAKLTRHNLKAHCEDKLIKEGDLVTIQEVRPISKTKQFIVIKK